MNNNLNLLQKYTSYFIWQNLYLKTYYFLEFYPQIRNIDDLGNKKANIKSAQILRS